MKKVLVVITGGTFSSGTNDNVMDIQKNLNSMFSKQMQQKYHQSVTFDWIYPIFTLSENMIPEMWSSITKQIDQKLSNAYDGIIVTHGSDTACYTVGFLSHYYAFLDIPLLITASNAPLSEPHANGNNNFDACVKFITQTHYRGTYFIYQDHTNLGDVRIYSPDELLNCDIYTDEFSYIGRNSFGIYQNSSFEIYGKTQKQRTFIPKSFAYHQKVLGIKPYTGLDYRFFDLSCDIKAIVHSCYHSNTVNCDKDHLDYSFLHFVKTCKKKDIDVYLCDFTKDRLQSAIYKSTLLVLENGADIIALPFECAYPKAIFAYNCMASTDIQPYLTE